VPLSDSECPCAWSRVTSCESSNLLTRDPPELHRRDVASDVISLPSIVAARSAQLDDGPGFSVAVLPSSPIRQRGHAAAVLVLMGRQEAMSFPGGGATDLVRPTGPGPSSSRL
jgi:hypothetical protein